MFASVYSGRLGHGSFLQQIFLNSTGQFAKSISSPWQILGTKVCQVSHSEGDIVGNYNAIFLLTIQYCIVKIFVIKMQNCNVFG